MVKRVSSGLIAGGIVVALLGLLWLSYGRYFISTATATWGHVANLDCHYDDEGTRMCTVVSEFVTASGETLQVRDGYSTNVHPSEGDAVRVYYQADDPTGSAMRSEPWGLFGGPIIVLLGLFLVGFARPMPVASRPTHSVGFLSYLGSLLGFAGLVVAMLQTDFGWRGWAFFASTVALGTASASIGSALKARTIFRAAPVLFPVGTLAAGLAMVWPEHAPVWAIGGTTGAFSVAFLHAAATETFLDVRAQRKLVRAVQERVEEARKAGTKGVAGELLVRRVLEPGPASVEVLGENGSQVYPLFSEAFGWHQPVFLPQASFEDRAAPADGYRNHGQVRGLVFSGTPELAELDSKLPSLRISPWIVSLVGLFVVAGLAGWMSAPVTPAQASHRGISSTVE